MPEIVEMAMVGVDPTRVVVGDLEPAGVSAEAVGGLTQVLAQLFANASAFSTPDQEIRVDAVFDDTGYLVTITDDGVGISDGLLDALNRILASPPAPVDGDEAAMGITMIARIAARHGIHVRLEAVPQGGTVARVVVPFTLVTRPARPRPRVVPASPTGSPEVAGPGRRDVFAPEPSLTIDLTRYDREPMTVPPPSIAMSNEDAEAAEQFLEGVFGPLRGRAAVEHQRPKGRPVASVQPPWPSIERETRATTGAALRMRVPGTNFSAVEDEPSVASSEAAIDLKTALARYEEGRRDADRIGRN